MSNRARGEWRLMRFLGGIVLGGIVTVGLVIALSLNAPLPGPAPVVEAPAIPAPDPGTAVATAPELAPTEPSLPSPVPQPSTDVPSTLRGALDPGQPADDGRFSAPEPFETTVTDNRIGGLPADATLQGPAPAMTVPTVEAPAFQLPGPAVEVNAVQFDSGGALPLIAVVLEFRDGDGFQIETLQSLSIPLTLAITPINAETVNLALEARFANYEVIARIPLTDSPADDTDDSAISTAMDDIEIEARIQKLMEEMKMAVGATVYSPDGKAVGDRIVRSIIPELARNGFALVNLDAATFESGRAISDAIGVPYAVIEAEIPAGMEMEEVIDLLDRVAEVAKQNGPIILSGRASRNVLEGLLRWGLDRESGRRIGVQLAPVSAVIRRLNAS